MKKKQKKDFTSFCQPTRLITCAKEWQEQQAFSEVKAVNNEVKDPHVIPLSKERPRTISVISEQISVGLSQRRQSSTFKYPVSPHNMRSSPATSRNRQTMTAKSELQKALHVLEKQATDNNAWKVCTA